MASDAPRVRLEGVPRHVWIVASVLALALVYAILEVGFVRPALAPDDPAASLPGVLLARPPTVQATTGAAALAAWRTSYWHGPRGGGLSGAPSRWLSAHLGRVLQVVCFIGAAIVLFALRSNDLTAALCTLALALSGVAAGGPLSGLERSVPGGSLLTLFGWLAGPIAFPLISLAILYFPTRSPLLARRPALQAVPFVVAAPMIGGGLLTALYLVGIEGARGGAVWDASHPGVFYASFAGALGLNVLVLLEGVYRYHAVHSANERRRIRMALYTGVPGVLGYAVKDGVPIAIRLTGGTAPPWPWPLDLVLQLLVLLPAFGLVYAVGVARVLGPRVVLRRSLQYALASRTLTILALLPAVALIVSLAGNPEARIRDVATSTPALLLAASLAALVYRERTRQWLDHRFFRQEYDARRILLSLASRVRYESDPTELAAMIVHQLDHALHPTVVAILVSGMDDGALAPVMVSHGSIEALPRDGGLVAMLRWSDQPLDVLLGDQASDPRSPIQRLPAAEREWLARSAAALLVPVLGQDRSLIGIIVLGERRSEEAYSTEDRELLASIAAQMGLGVDVARLRQRVESAGDTRESTRVSAPLNPRPMMECPRCGRCEDAEATVCRADGSTLRRSAAVPRVLDDKYRLEQLLGRGGMGAVYRARDLRLDRLVAVKVVRSELVGDPETRRRFRREAQIVARLQHPGIVSIFDYGTVADGAAYLVMELVRGEDLRRVLVREGRLDPARAARILSSVCAAIEAAHRQGVLHRDLKPENILLPGEDAEAKVLDFGVAKVIAYERPEIGIGPADAVTVQTLAGTIVGTPAYMAPEQLRGDTPDARTDVFSLGVITFEMLTGELPFGRGSLAEVVLAQSRGPLGEASRHLPPALARAVGTALEPDPDRRPPSPPAFAHLVNAAAEGWGEN